MKRSKSNGFQLIHRQDLLNSLVAIQSAQQSIDSNHMNDRDKEIYQAGFDAALLAIAQMVGQSEKFLAEKAKLKNNSD